jgi:hypothetical protein
MPWSRKDPAPHLSEEIGAGTTMRQVADGTKKRRAVRELPASNGIAISSHATE